MILIKNHRKLEIYKKYINRFNERKYWIFLNHDFDLWLGESER